MVFEFIEHYIVAILTATISLVSALMYVKTKVKDLDRRMEAFENMKLDIKLAVIETEITHIRVLLEEERSR